jgi:4-aminobutyrate aminotransferase
LLDGARAVAKDHPVIGDVRGIGLMIASEFTGSDGKADGATAAKVQQAAAERGLLLLTCGPFGNVVRMIPPLIVDPAQIDEGLGLWRQAVAAATN